MRNGGAAIVIPGRSLRIQVGVLVVLRGAQARNELLALDNLRRIRDLTRSLVLRARAYRSGQIRNVER